MSIGAVLLPILNTVQITLLHTLCLWSLNQNEQVKVMIANAYKSRTTKDKLDTNIPLSVQPWGLDGEKRRYWLVEGQNDTHFRVYRETDPHKTKKVKWFSVAGDIEELRAVATKLEEEDGRKEAKALGERMVHAIPRFEASEVVCLFGPHRMSFYSHESRSESVASIDSSAMLPSRGPTPASPCTRAVPAASVFDTHFLTKRTLTRTISVPVARRGPQAGKRRLRLLVLPSPPVDARCGPALLVCMERHCLAAKSRIVLHQQQATMYALIYPKNRISLKHMVDPRVLLTGAPPTDDL
jgi:hypothetical protein